MFQAIYQTLILPLKSIRVRYIPLLFIYFANGSISFAAIAETFWVKEQLNMSAVDLLALGVWTMVPWTIKMVFGQMVDSVSIFGCNRKIYVYIGAVVQVVAILMLIGVASNAQWVEGYSKISIFVFASVLTMVGVVMQDVVADTMSTEVIDKTQSQEDINTELATIQVLGRLTLAMALIAVAGIGGWMAQTHTFAQMLEYSLLIPLISVIGVTFVRLNAVKSSLLNKRIFFGGWLFALFIVLMGYNEVPYSQEIVFVVSLVIVVYMLHEVLQDLSKEVVRKIYMSMVIIFMYQLTPEIGEGVQWWQIDILGFDQAFFGTLRQAGAILGFLGLWFAARFIINQSIAKVLLVLSVISFVLSLPMIGLFYNIHELLGVDARTIAFIDNAVTSPFKFIATVLMLTLIAIYAPEGKKATWFALMASFMNIALAGSRLLGKYLNEIFVITREVKENGVVIVAQDYSQLGLLLWTVSIVSLVVPVVTILLFDPKEKHNTQSTINT